MTNERDDERLSDRYFSKLREGSDARVAIVPGDPDRVALIAEFLDDPSYYEFRRGYRAASGSYLGTPVWVVSTGVGGASLEHVVAELCQLEINTLIRVGTTGALQERISVGDLIVNDAAVRLDGTSDSYVRSEYPAAASWQVVAALVGAARASGLPTHVGVGATTSSFFAGQGRETFAGWSTARSRAIIEEMRDVGVLNFEMEAGALFTMARLFGMRAAAVCAVVNSRSANTMGGQDSIRDAGRVALGAAHTLGSLLAETDAQPVSA